MNKTQKIILIFAATIIFLMMLFPPFSGKFGAEGYRFILDRPSVWGGTEVNVELLMAQWVCISLILGIVYFIAKHDDFLGDYSNVFLQRCRKHPGVATIIAEIILLIFGLIFLARSFASITAWLFLTVIIALGIWWVLEHWDTQ